jgi:hypothetical protein
MSKKINVLIFPCGKENALELYQSLRYNVNVKVFGASSVTDHGILVYENYIGGLPFISEDSFVDKFNRVLVENEIDVVLPTHDTVTLYFAGNRDKFNTTIVCPNLIDATVCREKKKTYSLLAGFDFVPEIFEKEHVSKFPVFVKPNIGEGAKNTFICHNEKQLSQAVEQVDESIIAEYLPGTELTVDCFTNKNGELLFVGPRSRNRVQMGIAFNSSTYPLTEEIQSIATAINSKLSFPGLWYFQVKQDKKGKFKLLEISARVAGTMCLFRMLGINFALLTVYNALGKEVSILANNFSVELDRSLQNRYKTSLNFSIIYLDYDDTVIVNEKVNHLAIQFVFQMINKGKKIVLLTKHDGNLQEHMKKFRLSENLFDEIHHLQKEENKIDHIHSTDAIFVDNAFKEREEVLKIKGLPVFDVDALELFLT